MGLQRNRFIKQLLAAIMFGVFLLGITPKKLLHDVFANHTDVTVSSLDDSKPIQISKAGFHCQLDNLVAESPFDSFENPSTSILPFLFISNAEIKPQLVSTQIINASLRGPPSVA